MALNQELVIYFSAPKLFGSTVKGMSVFDANPVLSGVLCTIGFYKFKTSYIQLLKKKPVRKT